MPLLSLRAVGAPLALLLALAACQPSAPSADVAAPPPAGASVTPTATPDATPTAAVAADPDLPVVTVYKSPTCGCCAAWVDHMRDDGFRVEVVEMNDVTPIKESRGVPRDLGSCHTAVVDGYVLEGHVPAADVRRLLEERPEQVGLAVPGMPVGSPGMEQGSTVQPYDVVAFGRDGSRSVFAHHGS